VGIVKISEGMHEALRTASDALSRSINSQAEHWMRIGMLSELHPELNHSQNCRFLIRAEQSGGLNLQAITAFDDLADSAAFNVVKAAAHE